LQVIVVKAPQPQKAKAPSERPSSDEPLNTLKVTVGASLKTELEKLKLADKKDDTETGTFLLYRC
jgi:hypothetical protein